RLPGPAALLHRGLHLEEGVALPPLPGAHRLSAEAQARRTWLVRPVSRSSRATAAQTRRGCDPAEGEGASMSACVAVAYRADGAVAACVLFRAWTEERGAGELVERLAHVEPYQPGQFYRRELPCLLAVLGRVPEPLETVVVDGYVWLRDEDTPGLGAHLY